MKKVLSLIIALVLCLSFVACGEVGEEPQEPKNNPVIEAYIAKNKEALLSSMEASFATSAGMTCKSDVEVDGDGFIITIKIDQLENVEDSVKEQLQTAYDGMSATFEQSLKTMQTELKELEYYQVNVCDKNGDVLATITAGNK